MNNYDKIRELREKKELTQKQMAEKMYMHLTQYRRYESGESEVPLNIAIKMAEIYDVSIDYIAGRTQSPNGIIKNISEEQRELLEEYEMISDQGKETIKMMLKTLIEKKPQNAEKKSVI